MYMHVSVLNTPLVLCDPDAEVSVAPRPPPASLPPDAALMLVSTCCIATAAASAEGVMFSKLSPAEFELEPEAVAVEVAAAVLFDLAIACCCGWSACRTSRGWNWGRVQDGIGDDEKDDVRGSKSDVCCERCV